MGLGKWQDLDGPSCTGQSSIRRTRQPVLERGPRSLGDLEDDTWGSHSHPDYSLYTDPCKVWPCLNPPSSMLTL